MFRHLMLPIAVMLAWLSQPASGRILENWPYEKLLKDADLVVVAEAKETEDTKDKPTHSQMKDDDIFVGRTSTLKVVGTLKGKATGEEIKVLHFRLKDGKGIPNGPCFVSFRTKSVKVEHEGQGEAWYAGTQYLLFLKIRKDGRYEPVSGQYDPALSIRQMFSAPSGGIGSKD